MNVQTLCMTFVMNFAVVIFCCIRSQFVMLNKKVSSNCFIFLFQKDHEKYCSVGLIILNVGSIC